MVTPILAVPQTRGSPPAAALALPMLEVVHQPIYSAIALDAAIIPAETRFFNYAIGDVVTGAGIGATVSGDIHTSQEIASALPTPKVFECRGIRLVMADMSADLLTVLQTANPVPLAPNTTLDTLKLIYWGTDFRWHIGNKDYLTVPTSFVPANVGIGGVAGQDATDLPALDQRQIVAVQGGGKYFTFQPFPLFIPSQQVYFGELRGSQVTAPTLAVAALVWCIIDGVQGREVQ